jgi:hypothetical protein
MFTNLDLRKKEDCGQVAKKIVTIKRTVKKAIVLTS